MPKAVAVVKIVGDEDDLKSLFRSFACMRELGKRGASRTIKLHVDGDGSANCRFFLLDNDETEMVDETGHWKEIEFDEPALKAIVDKIGTGKDFEFYFGE